MKKLALCSALALVSLHAAADVTPRFYTGLSLSTGNGSEQIEYIGVTDSDIYNTEYDATGISAYGGYIFPSNNRFELSLSRINAHSEDGVSASFSGVDFDWKFTFGEGNISPYIGLGFGFYTSADTSEIFASNEDLQGYALTLAGGLIAKVSDRLQLDFSLSYKSIDWTAIKDESDNTYDLYDGVSRFSLGASYLF